MPKKILSVLATLLTAGAWLQPIHQTPWYAFQSDVWIGGVFAAFGVSALLTQRGALVVPNVALVSLAIALLIWLQYAAGSVFLAGDAWVGSLYFVAFAFSVVIGSNTDRNDCMGSYDILSNAMIVASVISVAIQFVQWVPALGNDFPQTMWVLPAVVRPSANLGQPNQLATLDLWAIGLVLSRYQERRMAGGVSLALSLIILFGVALTASRSALVALCAMVWFAFYFRAYWRSRNFQWVALGLLVLFLFISYSVPYLAHSAEATSAGSATSRMSSGVGIRASVWHMFLVASLSHPWIGFGFNQILTAQLEAVSGGFPPLGGILFSQSHNLFLDFVLWFGWPIGAAILIYVVVNVFRVIRLVGESGSASIFVSMIPVGVHAMLELPMHYAYFLLPFGFFAGVLGRNVRFEVWISVPRYVVSIFLIIGLVVLGGILQDYSRFQESFFVARMRDRTIDLPWPQGMDIKFLTQLEGVIDLSKQEAKPGMGQVALERMERIVRRYPSLSSAMKLARMYALNGKDDSAEAWLRSGCLISSQSICAAGREQWARWRQDDPRLARVRW